LDNLNVTGSSMELVVNNSNGVLYCLLAGGGTRLGLSADSSKSGIIAEIDIDIKMIIKY